MKPKEINIILSKRPHSNEEVFVEIEDENGKSICTTFIMDRAGFRTIKITKEDFSDQP